MTTIKVISNPYNKTIRYQRWIPSTNEWSDINIYKNANSRLLSEELTTGFLPFHADRIVDTIITEYKDESGQVEIVFQGTEDEFHAMEVVCSDETHTNRVNLGRSDRYLENAREVMPVIRQTFQRLHPVILKSIEGQADAERNLEKFTDAANDVIPLCILGNYSSGKSLFINSLIGNEVLPSGDEPVTARIYRITHSENPDRADVSFTCSGNPIRIHFENDSVHFSGDIDSSSILQKMQEELEKNEAKSLTERVNQTLSVINALENSSEATEISDLVEVNVPFYGSVWDETRNRFVILDTPGSNTASNEKHIEALEKAMESFSNGIPFFVTEYKTLDSTDNEKLYTKIKEMQELDSRFTVIVVNKADEAALPKGQFSTDQESRLLEEAVPRNLYAEGIFFTSAVIGLGAKTAGHFLDDHSAEVFEDMKEKFSDPEQRFYKPLYRYNILPEATRGCMEEEAEACSDLLLANSGIYSIEREIRKFAEEYSLYNKCQQASRFLKRVLEASDRQIEESRKELEQSVKLREEKLDADKRELEEQLREKKEECQWIFEHEYPDYITYLLDQLAGDYQQESLDDEKSDYYEQIRREQNIEGQEKAAREQKNAVGADFIGNFKNFVKKPGLSSFTKIGEQLTKDLGQVAEQAVTMSQANRQVEKAVGDSIVDQLNRDYVRFSMEAQKKLEERSASYWTAKSDDYKRELNKLVTITTALSDDQKMELSEIIVAYKDVDFSETEKVAFEKKDFQLGIQIGNLVLGDPNRLNLEKLRRAYNNKMDESVERIRKAIEESHRTSFRIWMEGLLNRIMENVVNYSPALTEQQAIINKETERIGQLVQDGHQITRGFEEISHLIGWKMMEQ